MPKGDRLLRPDRRAADFGRRAGRGRKIRTNDQIRIEDRKKAFEIAAP
jgi:hypothetical protein